MPRFIDDGVDRPPHADLLASLSATIHAEPANTWIAVGATACSACGASAAGVVGDAPDITLAQYGDRDLGRTRQERLRDELAHSRNHVAVLSQPLGEFFAATAIADDPEHGFLWISRFGAPFTWFEAVRLRELGAFASLVRTLEKRAEREHLLQLECRHQASNDLQLVASMLRFHGRASGQALVKGALEEAAAKVAVLAQARASAGGDFVRLLEQLCVSLELQLRDRELHLRFSDFGSHPAASPRQGTTALLAVNELITNAAKHAFPAGHDGEIRVEARCDDSRIRVVIADTGIAIDALDELAARGSGIDLVTRLLVGAGGSLALDTADKRFTIEVPLTDRNLKRRPE